MRIRKLSNKAVRSSDGWTLDVPDIHTIKYSEHGKTLSVEIEGGTSPKNEIIWYIYVPKVWSWDAPHYGGPSDFISEDHIQQVKDRISQALDILGMKHVFQSAI